jgi:hypothetical protein
MLSLAGAVDNRLYRRAKIRRLPTRKRSLSHSQVQFRHLLVQAIRGRSRSAWSDHEVENMAYMIVLYAHVLTTLVLASSFAIETLSLSRMRRAKTLDEARLWVNLVAGVPATIVISGLILFVSGGFLTEKMSAWTLAWPKVAVAALVLIAPLGAVSGKRMRGIRRMLLNGTNDPAMAGALSDRFLTVSLNLRLWILAGIVLLMTARPGAIAAVIIVAASVVVGFLVTVVGRTREAALTVVDAQASTRG